MISFLIRYASMLTLLVSILACQPKDTTVNADGVTVSLRPLWQTPANTGAGSRLAYGVYTAVATQNAVITPGVIPYPAKEPFGRAVWVMRDVTTGRDLWQWNDYMTGFENGYLDIPCVSNNRLLYNNGPRTHCIDLNTGRTLWQKWKRDSLNSTVPIVALGDSYFFCGTFKSRTVKDQTQSAVYRGSLLAPTEEAFVVEPQLPQEYFGILTSPFGSISLQVFARQADTLLVVDYQTATNEAPNFFRSVYGLYNITRKTWEYKDVPLTAPAYGAVVDGLPRIFQGNVYHSVGRFMTCHDLTTGKPIWENKYGGNFLFSGFLVVDNTVVANCEDGYIYGLDPQTGAQRWKEKSSGTSTRLYYQNGVVYYAGGGDGLLHAVDVLTGKHLWKLQSPDTKRSSSAFFQGMVAGVAGSGGSPGRIIANTGFSIVAYQAAR